MYSVVTTATLCGLDCRFLLVEADVSNGMPVFDMIGYLASEVKEAKERVRTALKNSGHFLPAKRITVNFSPANIRKTGNAYDLAIACALMQCLDVIAKDQLENMLVIGELGIDGTVRNIPGVLVMVAAARKANMTAVILPEGNCREAATVDGIALYPVKHLMDVVSVLDGKVEAYKKEPPYLIEETASEHNEFDFANVNGQKTIRRACEVAAAGGHNMLMVGPPGAGKSMIAKCMPSILPPLTSEEAMELSMIYSVAGLIDENGTMNRRPFCTPHHSITPQSLVGGGVSPRPGEVTLATHGILFLDELAEFKRSTLEQLRMPMEERTVRIDRLQASFVYPADFQLVAAMNPCPCGFYPDRNRCNCSIPQLENYFGRISGPFLDRIDLCVEAPVISYEELTGNKQNESSETIRNRVVLARKLQEERYRGETYRTNRDLDKEGLEKYCILTDDLSHLLGKVYEKMGLSVRGYYKILRMARTIADLAGSEEITKEHLLEAISYREIASLSGRKVIGC